MKDIEFVIHCHCHKDTRVPEELTDESIREIFTNAGEEPRVSEFKRLRKTPLLPKIEFSVLNTLCYIQAVRNMLTTGTLKNKEVIDEYTKLMKDKGILFDPDFHLLEIRAGHIKTIKEVEGFDKLYCEEVESKREYFICSGLRSFYKKEELEGNVYLFLLNMKKAKFRHLESEGMICCGSSNANERVVEALRVYCQPGTRIELPGHLNAFDDVENGKIELSKASIKKIFEEFKIIDHFLCFKGIRVKIGGEYIKTEMETGIVS